MALALAHGMNADAETQRTLLSRFFYVFRFSLYGILLDLLAVVVWVLYVIAATAAGGCVGEPCTAAGFLLSRVVFALQIGLMLVFYLCVIFVPLFAAPPLVGFVVDCVRASRQADDVWVVM